MHKYFLGTNFGHGSSAALLDQSGCILFAVEEERLNRKKGTDQFPLKSIQKIYKINRNISCLSEGWDLSRRLLYKGVLSTGFYGIANPYYYKNRLFKEIKRTALAAYYYPWLITSKRINQYMQVGHHLSHAYSLLPWGIPDNTLILVSDALAEKETISVFVWANNNMNLIGRSYYPNSIGSFFHQLAYHLGFRGRTGPGKLMALSAYGKPTLSDELFSLTATIDRSFYIKKHYQPWRINRTWLNFARNKLCPKRLKQSLLNSYLNHKAGVDLAASMQEWFTETTYNYIWQAAKHAREKLGLKIENLALAGGSALNCQANGSLIRRLSAMDIESLIVSPWSDDSGTAIGSAAFAVHKHNNKIKFPISTPFLGPTVHSQNLFGPDIKNHIKEAVEEITSGNIIALASGQMEFGPRALGARCLLCDARFPESRNKLNKLKSRPNFMPFAPIVLEDDFENFFYGSASSNMAWTVKAKPAAYELIPSAIHKSGEARVQLLKSNNNFLISLLLNEYKKTTGIGVLLLTSLNGKNEPIACNFDNCINTATRLKCTGMLSDIGWQSFKN